MINKNNVELEIAKPLDLLYAGTAEPPFFKGTAESSDGSTRYFIELYRDPARNSCTCPDFTYRRKDNGDNCKHILAVLLELVDYARERIKK